MKARKAVILSLHEAEIKGPSVIELISRPVVLNLALDHPISTEFESQQGSRRGMVSRLHSTGGLE